MDLDPKWPWSPKWAWIQIKAMFSWNATPSATAEEILSEAFLDVAATAALVAPTLLIILLCTLHYWRRG